VLAVEEDVVGKADAKQNGTSPTVVVNGSAISVERASTLMSLERLNVSWSATATDEVVVGLAVDESESARLPTEDEAEHKKLHRCEVEADVCRAVVDAR